MPITESLKLSLEQQSDVIREAEDYLRTIPTAKDCSVEIDSDWRLCFRNHIRTVNYAPDGFTKLLVVRISEDENGDYFEIDEARPLFEVPIKLRTEAVGAIPHLIDTAEYAFENFDKEVDANNELVRSRLRKNS